MNELGILLGCAIIGGAIYAAYRAGIRLGLPGAGFLCDRCKYNDVRYCSRPERPNATACPDFKER